MTFCHCWILGLGVSGFRFGPFAGGNSGYGVSIGVLALFSPYYII